MLACIARNSGCNTDTGNNRSRPITAYSSCRKNNNTKKRPHARRGSEYNKGKRFHQSSRLYKKHCQWRQRVAAINRNTQRAFGICRYKRFRYAQTGLRVDKREILFLGNRRSFCFRTTALHTCCSVDRRCL